MNGVEIGRRLKQLRGEKTIQQVSEETGINMSTLGMYEIGERIPRDVNKIVLAKYYGVSVQELFFEPYITDGDCSQSD